MPSDTLRRLAALTELHSGATATQRSLATRLGISLGLANALLRALENEGLIAVNRSATAQVLRYAVTDQGRTEMIRLGQSFADESNALLASLRAEFQKQASRLKADGHHRALICGCGPLADMAASALQNAGIKPVGVVAPDTTIGGVAGVGVTPLAKADQIACDVAVTFSRTDARRLRRHLSKTIPIVQLTADAQSKETARGR